MSCIDRFEMLQLIFHMIDKSNLLIIPFAHIADKGSYSTVPHLAEKVNSAFLLVLIISVVLLVLVTSFMVYFAVKYRASKNPVAQNVKEPLMLEIAWTVIPTILVSIIFYVGWSNFVSMREVPENAMPVKVNSRMWSWQFVYENGRKSDALIVPAGTPVKLNMTSDDVIHSLFIPDFKIKEDLVPGLETTLWFSADEPGEHIILCAEYCGTGHSAMTSKVIVMDKNEFQEWYELEEKGHEMLPGADLDIAELLEDNGCLDCHSTDGSEIVGPTFKGIYGRNTIVVSDNKELEIIIDEEYLKKSILDPEADVVKGYPDVMPSFEGEVSQKEIEMIIQYLKSIK